MHSKRVVHRDLKLENILVDDQFNLKIADFGFACFKNIDALTSYRGTMTYMAPEIKIGKAYRGTQVDLFSLGVILFIIVQGIFPFKEARKEEYFYALIQNGELEKYWTKTNGHSLTPEFKDLVLKLFSFDGDARPTMEDFRSHPWMNPPATSTYDPERARTHLKAEHSRRKNAKASRGQADSSSVPRTITRTAAIINSPSPSTFTSSALAQMASPDVTSLRYNTNTAVVAKPSGGTASKRQMLGSPICSPNRK